MAIICIYLELNNMQEDDVMLSTTQVLLCQFGKLIDVYVGSWHEIVCDINDFDLPQNL